jgi:chromosomal replication initiation ATPase DnaA
MGYRARVEPPTAEAYAEIFERAASARGIGCEKQTLKHVLNKYRTEGRQMKGCEPRDLLDRATDLCVFEGRELCMTPEIVDTAWRNYFGTSHTFARVPAQPETFRKTSADPLEL